MANVLHIEIAQKSTSKLKQSEILKLVKNAVEKVENPIRKFCLHDDLNSQIIENVDRIKFCLGVTTLKTCQSDLNNILWEEKAHEFSANFSTDFPTKKSEFHVFKLSADGENEKNLDKEISSAENNSLFRCFSLPCENLYAEWENLVFDPRLKSRLLDYIKTAIIYSQKCVSGSLISWSKVVLIHGPSGTGKSSLCRAFANKSVIRLGSRFKNGKLIEIDSHNLFSNRFSEGGKLVDRIFSKMRNFLRDSQTLVFLLIDQVENLATTQTNRNFRRSETCDSLRIVSSFLSKLDRFKAEFPNFVVLTTSNVYGLIDVSFVDRADLKLFLGNPTAELIYEMYASSINELIRVEIIGEDEDAFLPPTKLNFEAMNLNYGLALKLWEISVLSVNLTGRILKRIPFLAHCNFVNSADGSCSVEDYLEAMRSAVVAEKYQSENIDVKILVSEQPRLSWKDSFEPKIISVSEPPNYHNQIQNHSSSFCSSFSASVNEQSQNFDEIAIVPEESPSTSTCAPRRQPSISAESTTTTATSASISDSISTPSPNSTSGSGSSSSSSFNLKIMNADVRVNITPLPSPSKKIKSTNSNSNSEDKKERQKKRKTTSKPTEKIKGSKSRKIKSRERRKSTAEKIEPPSPNSRNLLSKEAENRGKEIKNSKHSKKESDSDYEETESDDDSDLSERRRSSRISCKMSKGKEVPKVEMNKEFFILKQLDPEVEVKLSEIPCAGQGLFGKKNFQPGEFLTEYGGDLLSRKEGTVKEKEYQTADKSLYLFFFTHEEKHYCIDAMESSSYGRFINHSKARANAVVKRVTVEGLPKLYFVASKPIRKGGEILYDYGETRAPIIKQLPWLKY